MNEQKLEPHEMTILMDLCRKAEDDAVRVVAAVVAIAPLEARPAIVIHTAFALVLKSALMVEVAAERSAGRDPDLAKYAAGDALESAAHVRILRDLLAAFANYPRAREIDDGIAVAMQNAGATTRRI